MSYPRKCNKTGVNICVSPERKMQICGVPAKGNEKIYAYIREEVIKGLQKSTTEAFYNLYYLPSNIKKKTKHHGLSPRATAACRRSDWQLFADRGCHVVRVTDPYGRILGFLRQEPLLFYQVAPQLYSLG
jgi:hypothetical protein